MHEQLYPEGVIKDGHPLHIEPQAEHETVEPLKSTPIGTSFEDLREVSGPGSKLPQGPPASTENP